MYNETENLKLCQGKNRFFQIIKGRKTIEKQGDLEMEYRTNRRTGDKISIIGLGASSISQAGEKEGIETLKMAFDNGINYFDLAGGDVECFPYYGEAFENVRDKVMYQIHFGANYETGSYGWTTNLEKIKKSIAWQLEQLRTDYIDYGFIHCIDEESDWNAYKKMVY